MGLLVAIFNKILQLNQIDVSYNNFLASISINMYIWHLLNLFLSINVGHIKDMKQNFDILAVILDFEVFSNANCYDNYLIQHNTSTTSIINMTKTIKQKGVSLWPSCG